MLCFKNNLFFFSPKFINAAPPPQHFNITVKEMNNKEQLIESNSNKGESQFKSQMEANEYLLQKN